MFQLTNYNKNSKLRIFRSNDCFINRIKICNLLNRFSTFFFFFSFCNHSLNFLHCHTWSPWIRENARRRERYVITTIEEEVRSVCKYCVTRRAMVAQRYLMSFDFIYGYRNTRDPRAKIYNLVQSWRDRDVDIMVSCVFSKVLFDFILT